MPRLAGKCVARPDPDGRDEIELRAEHDSNGGCKTPNPGENGAQVRSMHGF